MLMFSSTANPSQLFSEDVTPAGVPHLLQFLWQQYIAALTNGTKLTAAEIERNLQFVSAVAFATWCADYLRQNRAANTFFVEANQGITLTNHLSFVISPGDAAVPGSMQEAAAIGVTTGAGNPGDVTRTSSLQV